MLDHLFQLAVHSYYAGEADTGRRACERLLSVPLPPPVEMQTRNNRVFYQPALDDWAACRFVRLDVDPARPGWSLFNPSIIVHDGRLVGVVRSSNYRIVDGRYVIPPEDGQTIRTENLFVEFDDLAVARCRLLAGPEYATTDFPVTGLEDCRLRTTPGGGLGVSATVRNAAPFDGRRRIGVADLDPAAATLSGLRVLDGLSCQEHEKNWMAFEGGPLAGGWLYAANHDGHAVTVDADPDIAGAYRLHRRGEAPHIASRFRGGGQLVPFAGGYLAVVHEVAAIGNQRAYEHRFVWFDNTATPRRVSFPFAFREPRAIEFAAGLAVFDGSVVVSFGVRDAESWLVAIPAADVEALLHGVDLYRPGS